jgi:hypothetical protein
VEEKASAEEKAREKEKAGINRRFTRRLLPSMSRRLVTKLSVNRRERRERQREGASGDHWTSHWKVASCYVPSTSDKALDSGKRKRRKPKRKSKRKDQ